MMDRVRPAPNPQSSRCTSHGGSPGQARVVLVFVLDGLRPDAINPRDTPTLFRLRQEGVYYLNSHAVFPTVTRVNAAAIGTGAYPGTNGIVSNVMYVPAVNQGRPFNLGEFQHLVSLEAVSGGRLVPVKTLGEHLQEHALQLAVVSSGSTGSSLLLNPHARHGVGTLVNGYFDPGRLVAFPPEVNTIILERFGPAPAKGGTLGPPPGRRRLDRRRAPGVCPAGATAGRGHQLVDRAGPHAACLWCGLTAESPDAPQQRPAHRAYPRHTAGPRARRAALISSWSRTMDSAA